MFPSPESEFQRGHAVRPRRKRPLHGLSGLFPRRAGRYKGRRAGKSRAAASSLSDTGRKRTIISLSFPMEARITVLRLSGS